MRAGFYPASPRARRFTGWWYFVFPVLSFGLLTWVPFLHAATRTRRRDLRRLTLLYGIAALGMVAAATASPKDAKGQAVGMLGNTLTALFGITALVSIAVGCVQLSRIRREVYGLVLTARAPLAADPALSRQLMARERRNEARRLASRDTVLARQLRIGRPDLPREYDDGGLVDMNSAPAEVIAACCGLAPADAERIVKAREQLRAFGSLDELLVYAQIQGVAADLIREYSVLLPR
jgi:hypothetical protein